MQNITKIRVGGYIVATILALQSVWILAAELIRPAIPFFPSEQASREFASAHQDAAGTSASIGVIRGELWADYAMAASASFMKATEAGEKALAADALQQGHAAADRAVSLAPHSSRAWLLLAALASQRKEFQRQAAGVLKMSYYTGPNEAQLIPFRLSLATRMDAIADPEMQNLVRAEIRTIMTRIPELRPAIVAAYRDAIPSGQRFMKVTLDEMDPFFSGVMSLERSPK